MDNFKKQILFPEPNLNITNTSLNSIPNRDLKLDTMTLTKLSSKSTMADFSPENNLQLKSTDMDKPNNSSKIITFDLNTNRINESLLDHSNYFSPNEEKIIILNEKTDIATQNNNIHETNINNKHIDQTIIDNFVNNLFASNNNKAIAIEPYTPFNETENNPIDASDIYRINNESEIDVIKVNQAVEILIQEVEALKTERQTIITEAQNIIDERETIITDLKQDLEIFIAENKELKTNIKTLEAERITMLINSNFNPVATETTETAIFNTQNNNNDYQSEETANIFNKTDTLYKEISELNNTIQHLTENFQAKETEFINRIQTLKTEINELDKINTQLLYSNNCLQIEMSQISAETERTTRQQTEKYKTIILTREAEIREQSKTILNLSQAKDKLQSNNARLQAISDKNIKDYENLFGSVEKIKAKYETEIKHLKNKIEFTNTKPKNNNSVSNYNSNNSFINKNLNEILTDDEMNRLTIAELTAKNNDLLAQIQEQNITIDRFVKEIEFLKIKSQDLCIKNDKKDNNIENIIKINNLSLELENIKAEFRKDKTASNYQIKQLTDELSIVKFKTAELLFEKDNISIKAKEQIKILNIEIESYKRQLKK